MGKNKAMLQNVDCRNNEFPQNCPSSGWKVYNYAKNIWVYDETVSMRSMESTDGNEK